MKTHRVEQCTADAAREREIADLRAALSAERRTAAAQRKMAAAIQNELEARLGVALALKERAREASEIKIVAPKGRGRASRSVAFMVGSDWHVEQRVTAAEVGGLNRFDLSVAARRIENFFVRGLRLCDLARDGTDVDTLVLCLLGDHMTGYIHEELAESNALSPTETVVWLLDRIAAGISYLRANGKFRRIVIPCCVGNHGRTTPKRRIATATENSFEWLLYHILAQKFSEGIEWVIPRAQYAMVQANGRNYRMHHGDSYKWQGGIGGLTVPVNRGIMRLNQGPQRSDHEIFGHWHSYEHTRSYCCNGSLIGYTAHAWSVKAPFEAPAQAWFLDEERRGRTLCGPILVDDAT